MPDTAAVVPVSEARLAELAGRLREAQRTRTPCEPLTATDPGLTLEDAYYIQELNLEALLGNEGVVGRKIGLTSAAVQRQLGVDQPDFGALTTSMAIPEGGIAPYERLLQPRVEGEIAFILKDDLRGPDVNVADVLAATDFVLPAIEIADCRIRDWKIRVADTVADNAAAAQFVLGARPIRPAGLDMRLMGMALRINGEVAATGAGAACLGHPANAVAWLARKLAEFDDYLEAGQVILSGALCPLVAVLPGDVVEVQISRLGTVAVQFSREEA